MSFLTASSRLNDLLLQFEKRNERRKMRLFSHKISKKNEKAAKVHVKKF